MPQISLYIGYENLVLDEKKNFILISLIIPNLPICWKMCGYYREKIHVNHFWELKGLAETRSDGILILDKIYFPFLIEQNLTFVKRKL